MFLKEDAALLGLLELNNELKIGWKHRKGGLSESKLNTKNY